VKASIKFAQITAEYGSSDTPALAVKLRYKCSSNIAIRIYGIK